VPCLRSVHPNKQTFYSFQTKRPQRREHAKTSDCALQKAHKPVLTPEQFLTELSDAEALLEAEQGAIEHMNADHRDAMNLYATRLLGAEQADWRCTGCDPDGIDMQAGAKTLRLDFPERVTNGTALRKMLVRLAAEARAKA
jgi:putative heme iron utilization protein